MRDSAKLNEIAKAVASSFRVNGFDAKAIFTETKHLVARHHYPLYREILGITLRLYSKNTTKN